MPARLDLAQLDLCQALTDLSAALCGTTAPAPTPPDPIPTLNPPLTSDPGPVTLPQSKIEPQKSKTATGPRTPEGKARSSMNALKHGLTAQTSALMPTEDPAEYAQFHADMLNDLRPRPGLESALVERIIQLSWRLRRVPAAEAALFDEARDLQLCRYNRLNVRRHREAPDAPPSPPRPSPPPAPSPPTTATTTTKPTPTPNSPATKPTSTAPSPAASNSSTTSNAAPPSLVVQASCLLLQFCKTNHPPRTAHRPRPHYKTNYPPPPAHCPLIYKTNYPPTPVLHPSRLPPRVYDQNAAADASASVETYCSKSPPQRWASGASLGSLRRRSSAKSLRDVFSSPGPMWRMFTSREAFSSELVTMANWTNLIL